MKTTKIALACFIGSITCCGVAFLISPAHWWLGILAGIASGYIGYEFREFLQAIPVAWRRAKTNTSKTLQAIRTFFSVPHYFEYLSLALVFWGPALGDLILHLGTEAEESSLGTLIATIMLYSLFTLFALLLNLVVISSIATIGAKQEGVRWSGDNPAFYTDSEEGWGWFGKEDSKNKIPMTWLNLGRWLFKGSVIVVKAVMIRLAKFLFWYVPRFILVTCLFGLIRFVFRFGWNVFKLVHSKERVLCSIDGALGGAASYLLWADSAETLVAKLLVTLFGGFLGAAWGAINYQLISVRLLKLVPKPSQG